MVRVLGQRFALVSTPTALFCRLPAAWAGSAGSACFLRCGGTGPVWRWIGLSRDPEGNGAGRQLASHGVCTDGFVRPTLTRSLLPPVSQRDGLVAPGVFCQRSVTVVSVLADCSELPVRGRADVLIFSRLSQNLDLHTDSGRIGVDSRRFVTPFSNRFAIGSRLAASATANAWDGNGAVALVQNGGACPNNRWQLHVRPIHHRSYSRRLNGYQYLVTDW